MLTSLEILQASGISRATLNNYIALGLLPRPLIRNPGSDSRTRARQIGYFPGDAIRRVERIKVLKKEGLPMADIARQLQLEGFEMSPPQTLETPRSKPATAAPDAAAQPQPDQERRKAAPVETGPLKPTIDQVPYPAYMVNYNMELTWYNEQART